MNKINVYSEIGKLKTVLLHEPGNEIHNLTPKRLDDLLFDDIPWLPLAKKEHQAFAKTFIDNGVKVLYLVDLVSEALDEDKNIKEKFIHQFVKEANIRHIELEQKVTKYLLSFTDTKEMIEKSISGIKAKELDSLYKNDNEFITDPMPNLYFQRDPFASVGNSISLNSMYSLTRSRETIYGEYIFKYHPTYKNTSLVYSRDEIKSIEGGDILILNEDTILVGRSQRTKLKAIKKFANNVFYKSGLPFKNIIIFSIPKARTFMHLDTVFTQVDIDKFTIHKGILKKLELEEISKGDKLIHKKKYKGSLESLLEKYVGKKITLIPVGGDDAISADREQWSDGSNTIAIAPGVVIAYERNDITNEILRKNGIKVFEIPSSELSRGRGGPRCMCMPLEREEIKK